MAEAADRRRIEPVPVVLDREVAGRRRLVARPRRSRAVAPEWRATLLSASLTMPSSWRGRRRRRARRRSSPASSSTSIIELCRNSSTIAARPADAASSRSSSSGPQPEDEVADVADRQVEAVDRPLDPSLDLVGVVAHELRDVLERQADRVDALDDAVVQVLADALALVDDGQPLDLLVQPGVLDRDPGVDGERLDERWSSSENSAAPALSVRYRLPTDRPLTRDRDAQEAVHRRVVRREAVAPRVDRDVRDPERAVLADDQAEQAVAARQRPDPRPGSSRRCPDVMNRSMTPSGVDDPERGVARPDQRPDLVDDDLQDVVDGLERRRSPGSRRRGRR